MTTTQFTIDMQAAPDSDLTAFLSTEADHDDRTIGTWCHPETIHCTRCRKPAFTGACRCDAPRPWPVMRQHAYTTRQQFAATN